MNPKSEIRNPRSVRILIADDHAVVRDGLRFLIESHAGWEVAGEAATGREAVALARQLRPNVVVLDFTMADLNGLEATHQIRQALPDTEVLVLTMHDSDRLARHLLAAGARGFVLKSDAKSHLVAALEAVAQHQPYFTPRISEMVLQGYLKPSNHSGETSLPLERLTPREREILQLVAEGRTSKEIAAALNVSDKTVEAHRANLTNKLNLHSVAELVRYAVRNEIIEA